MRHLSVNPPLGGAAGGGRPFGPPWGSEPPGRPIAAAPAVELRPCGNLSALCPPLERPSSLSLRWMLEGFMGMTCAKAFKPDLACVPRFATQTHEKARARTDTQRISTSKSSGWVCAFPVPFVRHRLTLQRQAAVANRGLQGNLYSSPSSAKLEMGPQGHCGAGNRLCLFRREVLSVEQNPSPAAQRLRDAGFQRRRDTSWYHTVCLPCHELCCLELRFALRREHRVCSGDLLHCCIPLTPRAVSQPRSFTHLLFYPACHQATHLPPTIPCHFVFSTCLRDSCPAPQEFSWSLGDLLPVALSESCMRPWTRPPLMRAGASEKQSRS
nr:PREDICTED: uncharacterized protein LOC106701179 [Bos mutus]